MCARPSTDDKDAGNEMTLRAPWLPLSRSTQHQGDQIATMPPGNWIMPSITEKCVLHLAKRSLKIIVKGHRRFRAQRNSIPTSVFVMCTYLPRRGKSGHTRQIVAGSLWRDINIKTRGRRPGDLVPCTTVLRPSPGKLLWESGNLSIYRIPMAMENGGRSVYNSLRDHPILRPC